MKRLYRSENDRIIAGVCGGLGEYFDVDPTLIRVAWVIITVLTAVLPMAVAYLVLVVLIPQRGEVKNGKKER